MMTDKEYFERYRIISETSTQDLLKQHLISGYKVINETIEINTVLLVRILDILERKEK